MKLKTMMLAGLTMISLGFAGLTTPFHDLKVLMSSIEIGAGIAFYLFYASSVLKK